MTYIVVFEGTGGENSNTKGVRTIISFNDEASFERNRVTSNNGDKIIAKGVNDDKARELAQEMEPDAMILEAIEGSLINGQVDINRFTMNLANLELLSRFRRI